MWIAWEFQVPATTTLPTFLIQQIPFKYVFSDNWRWICGLVVKSFGSRDVFAGGHYDACCRSNAFDLHNTVILQILKFSSLWGGLF